MVACIDVYIPLNSHTCFLMHNCFVSVDINECIEGGHECGNHSQCKNTYGSYTCECLQGYLLNPDRKTCDRNGTNYIE